MIDYNKCPTCSVEECFACEEGLCIILNSNNFGERKCPFFKTREQVAEELAYCEKRMANDIRKGE